jgi:hypothetical protein
VSLKKRIREERKELDSAKRKKKVNWSQE